MNNNPYAGKYGYPPSNHYPYFMMDGNILKINVLEDIEQYIGQSSFNQTVIDRIDMYIEGEVHDSIPECHN